MSEIDTRARAYVPSPLVMRRVVNPITVWLGGPTLTVRGRRTGRPIRTPVPALDFEGVRYLVSGGGETHWVRNLRATGEGELRAAGRASRFVRWRCMAPSTIGWWTRIATGWAGAPASSSPPSRTRPITPSSGSSRSKRDRPGGRQQETEGPRRLDLGS